MKNKITHFLSVSLVLILVLCISVFSFLALFMTQKSTDTINQVGTLYMANMSRQISIHFETTIELRLAQLEAIVETVTSDRFSNMEDLLEELTYTARARGFNYLSFYSQDGNFEMIYGNPLHVTDPGPFLDSMRSGEMKVAVGSDAQKNNLVLLGVSCNYPMKNGANCIALVAALPVEYISDTLSLQENEDQVYSFIIRRDGTYVIRSSDAFRDSYFERVRAVYEDVDGRTPEEYLTELTQAMNAGEDYSSEFTMNGERRHLYVTNLAYSEWNLITFMPYGTLDESIRNLGSQWNFMAIASCMVVLIPLLLVFFRYFSMTRQQVKELEEAQQEAVRANHAKSEFLSNMSHDIRTPMNAIVGMTAIAIANFDNQQQVQNCLKKISLSSKHLLGLINDVLDMSKIESGKMTLSMDRVSLREVMDSIVSIVQPQAKAKRQQFDVFIHDVSTENVYCDSVRLNQVLLNLLSNAVKFTPEEGVIHVALCEEASPKGEEYIRVHLKVRDSGIGMSPEFRAKIFESFSREDSARVHKIEGTGLGMAITKYIVDAMKGTIEVQSEQGKGSEFHITLDLEKAEEQTEEMILPSWNMLVVDDDQQLCESTVDALKDIGIQAEWTLDGESAVQMVEQRWKEHKEYQIILLDWRLPGMDGIETARTIRQRIQTDIPILLISAYDWSEIEEDARKAGVNGFIAKPLFKSTLFHGLKPFVQEESETPAPVEHEATFKNRRILLAEDNELNWEVAKALLEEVGLKLEWAENGKLCLEKFQAAQPGDYDAILMDVRMPVMNGYEATQAIRALDRADAKRIPIIAMTADAFAEDIKHCLDCGMNAHVAKPINVQEIIHLLERFMEEKTQDSHTAV